MDEYESGIDPEVRKYFKKIISSFSYGLLWMIAAVTIGIFFKLGFIGEHIRWFNVVFYLFFLATFILLLRFFYRTWRNS